jgi:hypothetical protein
MIQVITGDFLTFRPLINPKACRPEWNEQVDFVAWMRQWWPDDAALMIHPANEGQVSAQYRQSQIKSGMLKGASDLILLKGGYSHPCALLEMKREWHKSKPTEEQRDVLQLSAADGKFSAVCNGADAAKVAFILFKKGLHGVSLVDRVALPLIEGYGR